MVYTWRVSGGGNVLPSTSDTLYVDWGTVPGTYTVSLVGSINATCETDTAKYNIRVLPPPVVAIQGNTQVCAGEKVTLSASGALQYVWNNGTTGSTAEFYPAGPAVVWAVGYDGTCFSDTVHFNLNPVPLPVASFTANPLQGEAPLSVSFFDQSANGAQYFWDFGNGEVSSNANPSTIYKSPGSYTVRLVTENAAGCKDSTLFEYIVVDEAFTWYIPNTFTPNGDSRNEVFRPYFPDFVEYTLGIYDRWGNVIYESTSVDGAWDGKKNQTLVPQGVYEYRLVFRNPNDLKQHRKIGAVTLIR